MPGCGHSSIRANLAIMKVRIRSGIVATLALVMGCSDDGGNAGPAGRGTATCNQWQSALCQWIGRCTMPPAGACDQIKAIACKSDSQAEHCATALSSASCSAPPENCDVRDLADPAPAKKACEDFGAAFCQKSEECTSGSRDPCLQEVQSTLPCSEFIGVTLAYEQCVAQIRTLACTSPSPEVCKGILLK